LSSGKVVGEARQSGGKNLWHDDDDNDDEMQANANIDIMAERRKQLLSLEQRR